MPADGFSWMELLLATPVVLWGGCAVFSAWLGLHRQSLDQHVHADRDGHRRGLLYSLVATIFPQNISRFLPRYGWERPPCTLKLRLRSSTLVLLGQVSELRARSRTGAAIRALLDLQPKTAAILRDSREEDIPLEQVRSGRPLAGSSWRKNSRRWRRA